MSDHKVPDYDLADTLDLEPDQVALIFESTRTAILELIGERAATTSQLAEALGKPKGTVGYHCKALEAAGLIRVVRTRRVRAMEEKYYGRTARTFLLGSSAEDIDFAGGDYLLREFLNDLDENRANPEAAADSAGIFTVRRARISHERAAEWSDRLAALADEFVAQPREGDTAYGIVLGVYLTLRPVLQENQ